MFTIPLLGEINPDDLQIITDAIESSKEELIEASNIDGITKNQLFLLSIGIAVTTYLSKAIDDVKASIRKQSRRLGINRQWNFKALLNKKIFLVLLSIIILIAILTPALDTAFMKVATWFVVLLLLFVFIVRIQAKEIIPESNFRPDPQKILDHELDPRLLKRRARWLQGLTIGDVILWAGLLIPVVINIAFFWDISVTADRQMISPLSLKEWIRWGIVLASIFLFGFHIFQWVHTYLESWFAFQLPTRSLPYQNSNDPNIATEAMLETFLKSTVDNMIQNVNEYVENQIDVLIGNAVNQARPQVSEYMNTLKEDAVNTINKKMEESKIQLERDMQTKITEAIQTIDQHLESMQTSQEQNYD